MKKGSIFPDTCHKSVTIATFLEQAVVISIHHYKVRNLTYICWKSGKHQSRNVDENNAKVSVFTYVHPLPASQPHVESEVSVPKFTKFFKRYRGYIHGLCMGISFVIFLTVVKCQHKQWRRFVRTCRRFTPQNWLLWQCPLTDVQIFSHGNFSSRIFHRQS